MLSRIPDHVRDEAIDTQIKSIQAAQVTNTTSLATAVAALTVLKDAGLGATDGELGTVLALFTTAATVDAAVATTVTASSAVLNAQLATR